MTVRRLAPPERQPAAFAFTDENAAWATSQIAKFPPGRQASAVIPLLWRAQEQEGWVTEKAIEAVAAMLDLPKIRVLEVATFYSMFNLEPVGRHFVQLCGTVPCHLVGAEELKAVCRQHIGPERQVTPDGRLSWLEVECLGACVNAPMVQIGADYYEDLTPAKLEWIIGELRAGRTPPPGPQVDRQFSAPLGGETTLTDPSLYARRAPESATVAAAEQAPRPAPVVEAVVAAEALAKAEEADIAAKLATLPRDATAEQKADAVGARPAALPAARQGARDNLQRIKGIGPVNETKLNALGVFHFDQIAGWTRAEIRWVGTYLAFPGRIDREEWVAQAALLAKGGKGLKD
jgi:NADH-quinone oxidoreductase subunit E